jgi:CHC2 zinc finger
MLHSNIRREIAAQYHNNLPDEIRSYLRGRGIPSTIVERELLGWNGERIVIPVFGHEREVLGFRYATVPAGPNVTPDIVSDMQLGTQLYGLDRLLARPRRIVICEGEFDRLVLEANGIAAVTSTEGAATFLVEWLPYFEPVAHVYVCFRRNLAGVAAAKKIQRLLPRAVIVTLPSDVGQDGTITDYFVDLQRTKPDFEVLLAASAMAAGDHPDDRPPEIRELRPNDKSVRRRVESVKRAVRLHDVVANFTELTAHGRRLGGHCPFCNDRTATFAVYPENDTYRCSGCDTQGDVVQFLLDKESMTVEEALKALEGFQYTHELYATSS